MKITIFGITFEPTREDFDHAREKFEKISKWFANHKTVELTIAFIDERYSLTGYIISYGRLKISKEKLRQLCTTERHWVVGLEDYLTKKEYKKYVIEDSGELNGYEIDTPENFDIIIKN